MMVERTGGVRMSDVNIRLSSEDAEALRDILTAELPELEWEEARSHYRKFRHEMAERNQRLRHVLEQLEQPGTATTRDETRPDAY